jgi:uncharacterized RDD family membrane protein YckC/predicted RNA-binding Zn-ribbon protein involved in translation (DUF1610 family)
MSIQVACPSCGAVLRTKDSYAGRTAKCPECSQPVQIPEHPEEAVYELPDADDDVDFGETAPAGEDGSYNDRRPCPACGEMIARTAAVCRYCGEALEAGPRRRRRAEPAGFWLRFGAYFIDTLIISIVGCFVGLFVGIGLFVMMAQGLQADRDPARDVIFNLIGLIIGWLYWAGMESSSNQATLGKMAVGIKVTDMNGNRITFARASGRYFGKILSGLICLIGYVMAAFTEQKQALHDILAGCLVVRE